MQRLFQYWSNRLSDRSAAIALLLCTWLMLVMFALRDDALVSLLDAEPVNGQGGSHFVERAANWDSTSRAWYATTQLTLDFVFPLVYGSLLLACFQRLNQNAKWRSYFRLLVCILIVVDWSENILEALLAMQMFPGVQAFMARALYLLSSVKWILLADLCLEIFAFTIFRFVRFLEKPNHNWQTLLQQAGRVLANLVRARFPVLAIMFLIFWAPIFCLVPLAQSLGANLLIVEHSEQLIGLGFVTALASYFSLAILRRIRQIAVSEYAPDEKTPPWNWALHLSAWSLAAFTPIVAVHYSYQQSLPVDLRSGPFYPMLYYWALGLLWTALGIGLATMLMRVAALALNRWLHEYSAGNYYFPFRGPLQGNDAQSAVRFPKAKRIQFDLEIALYLFVVLMVYWFALPAAEGWTSVFLPVSAYVVLLVWIVSLVFSGLSAWLDSTRIPIAFIALVIVLVVQAVYSTSTYTLPVIALESPSKIAEQLLELRSQEALVRNASGDETTSVIEPLNEAWEAIEDSAWGAIEKRLEKLPDAEGKGKSLVIVTCPGGGIHATAWSSLVLKELSERYLDFADSIVVVSGVSGGSVGAMFFANYQYFSPEAKSDAEEGAATEEANWWNSATQSSLRDLSSALALHDVPIVFAPFLQGDDRGLRLEGSWQKRLRQADQQTLSHWGERALEGNMPVMIFNATDAASGRRVLFGSLPTPPRPSLTLRLGRPLDFRELLQSSKHDLHVATAARASATFPYVSPLAKPKPGSKRGKIVALGDGGFADNEGIISAIDWLDFITRRASEQVGEQNQAAAFKRIIVLRIQPSSDLEPADVDTEKEENSLRSRLRWLTGPLEALASMRVASQVERGYLEVDLATNYIESPWWAREVSTSTVESTSLADNPPKSAELDKIQEKLKTTQLERDPKQFLSRLRSAGLQQKMNVGDLVVQRDLNAWSQYGTQREVRADIGNELRELIQKEPQTPQESKTTRQEDKTKQSTASEELQNEIRKAEKSLPIITLQIPFVSPEPDAPIPLNWKLSTRQLSWYPKAWERLEQVAELQQKRAKASNEGSADSSVDVLTALDAFFTKPSDN